MRELRIHFQIKTKIFSLCKIAFTKNDASFYIFPYAKNKNYYYGETNFDKNQRKKTFSTKNKLNASEVPTLSIHESGEVHVYVGKSKTENCKIPHLSKLRGEHIATIIADPLKSLREYKKKLKKDGDERDIVFAVDEKFVKSVRMLLYLNGKEAKFDASYTEGYFTLNRSTLNDNLYMGFTFKIQDSLANDLDSEGVTVIAGWNPFSSINDSQDFIYITAN